MNRPTTPALIGALRPLVARLILQLVTKEAAGHEMDIGALIGLTEQAQETRDAFDYEDEVQLWELMDSIHRVAGCSAACEDIGTEPQPFPVTREEWEAEHANRDWAETLRSPNPRLN